MQKQRNLAKRVRRQRHEPPKVWHNPDVVGASRAGASRPGSSPATETRAVAPGAGAAIEVSRPARPQRIVALVSAPIDAKTAERDRLLARLAVAEGRTAISRAADAFAAAGFDLPDDDQAVQLQLLEHTRDDHVEAALAKLSLILAGEPCKRQAVLESRLRRLEEFAEEPTLRDAARRLRRQVTGRLSEPHGE